MWGLVKFKKKKIKIAWAVGSVEPRAKGSPVVQCQFSSRWYLCGLENPYALHCVSPRLPLGFWVVLGRSIKCSKQGACFCVWLFCMHTLQNTWIVDSWHSCVCVCVSLLSCSFFHAVLVIASISPSILSFRKNSMLYKNNKIQLMAVDHYRVFFPSICLSVDTGWDNQTWVSIEHKVGMYFEYVTTVHYVR